MLKSGIMVVSIVLACSEWISPAICQSISAKTLQMQAKKYAEQKGNELLAIQFINQAIKIEPNNQALYLDRAELFGKIGLYSNAIIDLNHLIKHSGIEQYFLRRNRADCYAAIGEFQKAIEDYQYVVKTKPDKGKYWYYYAELLWFVGKKEDALLAAKKGLSTESHWKDMLNKLIVKIMNNEQSSALHKPFSN